MGEQNILDNPLEPDELRAFTRALLDDVAALERMLDGDVFETGVRRIGAEQELFLVDRHLDPAPVAPQLLERLSDPRLTSELGRFNLEANLTPRLLHGGCLRELESEVNEVLGIARKAARTLGAQIVMAGILPTLRQSHLGLANMSPGPRYARLNEAMTRLRGGVFSVHIQGPDELSTQHDNVMLESCNTSFQVHLQAAPAEFAELYNLAQAATAPVLAASVNAPLLFGRRLWQETRIALFERSVDERSSARLRRDHLPRVTFGDRWVDSSVLEIFREDIARFRIVIARELEEPSTATLARGGVPKLSALCLHNGTVYRWNRACYGATGARPHLRIEQRALPAGPTVVDEVASSAFFFGLVFGLRQAHGPISRVMSFEHARDNFFAAARSGLRAQLTWVGGQVRPAAELILDELLPAARAGLAALDVDGGDIDRYLGIIEERVRAGRTGAEWALQAIAGADPALTPDQRDHALTAALLAGQKRATPVHTWPLSPLGPVADGGHETIAQLMSTDLYTVRPDDLVELAASVMEWNEVHHIPVEDDQGRLVGVLSHKALLPLIARAAGQPGVAVRELMDADPPTVTPVTPSRDAIRLMLERRVSCLPVVEEGRLVGLVTEHDFMKAAARLL